MLLTLISGKFHHTLNVYNPVYLIHLFFSSQAECSSCVCVCVCVCVCSYPSTVKASSVCNDVLDIMEGTDQCSCTEGIILDTSAKSLHL